MWLSNCAIVLPDTVLPHGAVRIEDGHIAEIRDQPVAGAEIDGDGMLLMPGLVDLHGDMIERELEPRPGASFPLDMAVVELDKRLAAAGVTTAFAAVSFSDGVTFGPARSEERAASIIDTMVRLRPDLVTDMRVHARFEVNNERAAPVLFDLVRRDSVGLVSLTDHTPGQGQYRDIERYITYVTKKKALDKDHVTRHVQARLEARAAQPQTWAVVKEVTGLARQKGLPIASHDDDTPDKVALMHDLGARISEFPVTLEAAHTARRYDMSTVMGAPNALRGVSHAGNLGAIDALKADALDALAADYHPGAMLCAALTIADAGLAETPRAVAMVSSAPARAVGLDDRGEIAVGKRADLALVASKPTPRVRATFRGGALTYGERQMMAQVKPRGVPARDTAAMARVGS